MIPYGRQQITTADIDAVVEVLQSDFLTQGPAVPRFERAVADYGHAAHAVAVNSGTSALHLACRALELGPGDLLWTSPLTFVASANCALHCGAGIDFVDIDPATGNLCPQALEARLEAAARADRLPKIVMPVHFGGEPCDLAAIHELALRYGFRIVEDASHALGARYRDEPVGCGRYSDIAVFSFHPVKLITTGEGGVAVTNQPDLAARMALLRSHGITREPEHMDQAPDGPWYYQQIELGYNYRMTDLQAALGASQLQRLDAFVDRRNDLAAGYDTAFADLPLTLPATRAETVSARHLYVIRVPPSHDRRQVFEQLRSAEIGVNVHYIPVHTQPWYRALGFSAGDFPLAEAFYAQAISLPLHPGLTATEHETVIAGVRRALA